MKHYSKREALSTAYDLWLKDGRPRFVTVVGDEFPQSTKYKVTLESDHPNTVKVYGLPPTAIDRAKAKLKARRKK